MRRSAAFVLALLVASACAPAAKPPEPVTGPGDLPGRVVYVEDENLWLARPDGGDVRRLTSDGAEGPYRGPKWSPDGAWIVAQRLPPPVGGPSLVLLDPATGAPRPISNLEVSGYAWSRDGSKLAVAIGDMRSSVIQILDVARASWRGAAAGMSPAWSPVDDRLAFEMRDGAIGVLGTDGRVALTLRPDEVATAEKIAGGLRALYRPSWSYDAAYLGFVAVEGGDLPDAVHHAGVAEAKAGGKIRTWPIGATGHLHDFPMPVWSPREDVFVAAAVFHVPHVHYYWLGDPRASELTLLREERPHFLNPIWSPDGRATLLALDDLHEWAIYPRTGRDPFVIPVAGMWPDWCCASQAARAP